ncbi:MAG: hypothetical protein AAB368_13455, partial [bacterium]
MPASGGLATLMSPATRRIATGRSLPILEWMDAQESAPRGPGAPVAATSARPASDGMSAADVAGAIGPLAGRIAGPAAGVLGGLPSLLSGSGGPLNTAIGATGTASTLSGLAGGPTIGSRASQGAGALGIGSGGGAASAGAGVSPLA